MKDKIKQLAKGRFEYEVPSIVLSEESINVLVEAGTSYHGSFSIMNDGLKEMKGVLYSSNRLLKLANQSFVGVEHIIEYEFVADNLKAGEVAKGTIQIVCNCGELELPFIFSVEPPYCMTSIGKMRDLFHFANLAKADSDQALSLFKSEEFERVFLYNDPRTMIIYKSLIKSSSTSHALEEFLIAIHKKVQIKISVDKTNCEFNVIDQAFMDKIVLTKDTWGFVELKVTTDVPYIIPEHKVIGSNHFVGNRYSLEYVIHPELMRNGRNYGHIYIKSTYQTIEIEIVVLCNKGNVSKNMNYFKRKEYRLKIVQNYLNFRTNQIATELYVADAEAIIHNLLYRDELNQISLHLMRIHLHIIDGNEELVEELVRELDEKTEQIGKLSVVEYCIFLYLKALHTREEVDINKAVNQLRGYYNQGQDDWEILWCLLYLDRTYDNDRHQKLKDIYVQIKKGYHSPILYYEVCTIYNEEPALLTELSANTIQAMNWAMKRDYMSLEVATQYTYLAGREKKYNGLIFRGLVMLYQKYQSQDVLTSICSMLIKGQKIEHKYYIWYKLGVEAQLRLTELYESYLYALDENTAAPLPQAILLYFIYDNRLSDKKKAYLYANIITNKENNSSIFHTYEMMIERFAYKQLAQHNINHNLAVIYKEVFSRIVLDEKIAKDLPYIMFQYDIICSNPDMVGVIVIHKEVENEVFVPFISGRAQINIFTENVELFLTDYEKNRYVTTVEYTLNRFINMNEYTSSCYELNHENTMLMLNLYEKIDNYQRYDANAIQIRKQILQLPDVRANYVRACFVSLLEYCYDNFEVEQLEALLQDIDLQTLGRADRRNVIEKAIIRDLFEKALDGILKYGFEGISLNRLIKLCKKLIHNSNEEERIEVLVDMGHYIFRLGKYEESILKYLVKHYNGTTNDMFELWKVANDFELDTETLSERLLVQMLFAESYLANAFSVFSSYYKNSKNQLLIRAFLSYNAYRYLVHGRVMNVDIFDIMKKELHFEENEICMLALIKYYSEKVNELTQEELKFVDINLNDFIQKGIILPFFKVFQKVLLIPNKISNKYFVEYICNPCNTVKIYYALETDEGDMDFISETMKNVYQGIHIKDFVLFYGETLQYYITEESQKGEIVTESYSIMLDQKLEESDENEYASINLIRLAREMNDEKTLLELMENHVKTKYAVTKLFKAL